MIVDKSDYLAHYGVLGMKWGVRKNPDRAYSKSIKKLRKIDEKQQRVANSVGDKDRYNVSKLANKSVKAHSKAERLSVKSQKLQAKSDKLQNKALRAMSTGRRTKLAAKSLRAEDKSKKVESKSEKYEAKSRAFDSQSKQLSYKIAKADYKSKQLQDKGRKWIERMNKEFAGKTLSSVSHEDIEYGKKRAVEIANMFDDAKHSDVSDEIYFGVLQVSEELAHYGVKGMKWPGTWKVKK